MARIAELVRNIGEEGFTRRMEGIPTSERREIFQRLAVPPAGPSASARARVRRRIEAAWQRLGDTMDEEAADHLARAWLERHAMAMIAEFLDRFGVEHAGGFLREEDALSKLPASEIPGVLRELAARHDPDDVRLYAAVMALPGAEEVP